MTKHKTGTREEWLAARLDLLKADYDFNASFTEEQQRTGNVNYNYSKGCVSSRQVEIAATETAPEVVTEGPRAEIAESVGTDWATYIREMPGMSAFALEDGVVYHTYSAYARGLDGLWGGYPWLDRAPTGRNETGGIWWRRHDEYESQSHNPGSCCR